MIRTKFIDYDARRTPKTERYCVKCQKDLSLGKLVRLVFVTWDMHAVHPDDMVDHPPHVDDLGWLPIGMVCAQVIGLEWSIPDVA